MNRTSSLQSETPSRSQSINRRRSMNNKRVWHFVFDCLQQDIPVMILAVVDSAGASPGKAGFKMAIAANGERCGTIGGGIMEVNWTERSLKLLRDGNVQFEAKRIFHSRETEHEQSGLICSGSQTLLTMPLDALAKDWIASILDVYQQKQFGCLKVSASGYSFEPNKLYEEDFSFTASRQNDWLYRENLGVLDTVYIIGSGHVGLALSRVMATLDFRVVAIDDRGTVETFVKNSYADEKILSSYDMLHEIVKEGNRSYVALVTTAYTRDEAALKSIINKNLKYIGLMGSPAKTKHIFDDLQREGIAREQLQRIHSPIGVPIGSHSPEEIAISIAAEIIKVRNGSA